MKARPFLKWAGGKTQLLSEILPALPERMKTYYEPFIGGGAVYFALANEHRFERAQLSDLNPEIVEVHTVVRDDVEALIELLREHKAKHSRKHFEGVRGIGPLFLAQMSAAERAARTIYLNKGTYNGLYRQNRFGDFNSSYGKDPDATILDADNLRAGALALRGVELLCCDFEDVARRATDGDGIFLDPPYWPISETSSFAAYHARGFRRADHERLARVYGECLDRGVGAVLSNSDCPTTRELYADFQICAVKARRSINNVGGKRGPVPEILVVGSRRDLAQRTA